MSAADIVYVVKHDENNEELRYSLRSLKHVPHRKVWMAGYRPSWVSDRVGHIPVPRMGSKFASSTANLLAACQNAGVSEEFYFFHDDNFVMRPMPDGIPVFHRGRVADVEASYLRRGIRSRYFRGLRETRDLIVREGISVDPISYELHAPLAVRRTLMIAALGIAARARLDTPHKRTLYGNLARIGGTRLRDPKVMDRGNNFRTDGLFLSTMDSSFRFGMVGVYIRDQFPGMSPYEAANGKGGPRPQPVRASAPKRARRAPATPVQVQRPVRLAVTPK